MSVCAFLCWLRGRGIGLECTPRFSFHEFYNFLLFKFLILIFFGRLFFTHDNYPHPHPRPTPTTHDGCPRPTTHDPRHLAILLIKYPGGSTEAQSTQSTYAFGLKTSIPCIKDNFSRLVHKSGQIVLNTWWLWVLFSVQTKSYRSTLKVSSSVASKVLKRPREQSADI